MRSPDQPANLLHLGDSYTCAEGISPEGGWVHSWHRKLAGKGSSIGKTRTLARTGWTCSELLQNMTLARLDPEWNWISICIGVNNQYRGHDAASFEIELIELVKTARQLLSKPTDGLVLLSIPDWGVSPFAADRNRVTIAAEIDAYNAVIRAQSNQVGVPYLNWTGLTRSFAGQPDAFAPDRLHPSARQYSAWAEFLSSCELGC